MNGAAIQFGTWWPVVHRLFREGRAKADWEVQDDEGLICTIEAPADYREDVARLIAAAPDGLRFAEEFIAYIDHSDLDDLDFGRGLKESGLIEKARAFAAKARGAA